MFLLMCMLPLVLAAPLETTLDNYKLHIEEADSGKILKNVEFKSDKVLELDLSNMNLKKIDESALQNVPGIKSLNLSSNLIDVLPNSVFSTLTNLEYLSLANNNLLHMKNHFIGLKNLQTLDVSRNPLLRLYIGERFGLSKSVTVLTTSTTIHGVYNQEEPELPIIFDDSVPLTDHDDFEETKNTKPYIKLCTTNGIITSIANLKHDENLPAGCTKLPIEEPGRAVLDSQGITGFQKGWFDLLPSSIANIFFKFNNISTITEDTLNDLPAHITNINFQSNQIKRIPKGVIKNNNLRMLALYNNEIEFIEADAFADTKVETLLLNGNKIRDLSFVSSLPQTLKNLDLGQNELTSIPDGIFASLPNLKELVLQNNAITRLQNGAFGGLSSLKELTLAENNIREIEPEVFKGLEKLEEFNCQRNSLVTFPSNVWSPLTSLKKLNLMKNEMTKITKDTFNSLSKTVEAVHLSSNRISSVESDSFVEVPQRALGLGYNQITNVPRGALKLPKLKILDLTWNNLTEINPESYEGLPELTNLLLATNQISDVSKGACRNFKNLGYLDLSFNPMKELKNGALYGLDQEKLIHVRLQGNQLEKIHGGAFEDV